MNYIRTEVNLGTERAFPPFKISLAQTEEIVVIMDDRDGRGAVRAVRASIALNGHENIHPLDARIRSTTQTGWAAGRGIESW